MSAEEAQVQAQVNISIKDDAIAYDAEPILHGWYAYQKLNPTENISPQVITDSGGETHTYLTTAEAVFNSGESVLEGVLTPAASGTAGSYTWFVNSFASWIRNITSNPIAGSGEMDKLESVHHFYKLALGYLSSMEEYKTHDLMNVFAPSNQPVTANKHINGFNAAIPFDEPQHLIAGTSINTVGSPTIYYRIPLSMFKGLWISTLKDQYFAQSIQIQFLYEMVSKWLFTSTSPNNPTAGAGNFNATCTNAMVLQLAVQQDEDIKKMVKEEFRAGKQLLFTSVKRMINQPMAAGAGNFTYNMTRTNGIRALRIFNGYFPQVESGVTSSLLDNNNWANGVANANRVTQIRTQFDDEYLQTTAMNSGGYQGVVGIIPTFQLDDYSRLQRRLRGSVIQNALQYYREYLWADDFTAVSSRKHAEEDIPVNNKIEGRALDDKPMHTYNHESVLNLASNVQSYLQSLRVLTVQADVGQVSVS